MDLTIYTTTDGYLMFEALRAVSAVFSSPSNIWTGAGLAGVGAVLGLGLLLTMAIQAVTAMTENRMIAFQPLLLGLIIYTALFVPTRDVNIEDLETGAVYVVDDVPLGIAMSGAFISGITKTITEEIEVAFQSLGVPEEFTVTEGGFLRPHRLFLATREMFNHHFPEDEKLLTQNLALFVYNCVVNRPELNPDELNKVSNPSEYLFDSGRFGRGLSYYATGSNPPTAATTCAQHAAMLNMEIENFFMQPSGPNGTTRFTGMLTRTATDKKNITQQVSLPWEWNDLNLAVQSLFGTSVSSYDLMNKLFVGEMTRAALSCGTRYPLASYTNCVQNALMETQAFEQARSETAGGASSFLNFMQPTMVAFQFLFFALSPLVAIVVAISGMRSMKILLNYFLFGIWSQSWTAVAAIINFMILTQTRDVLVAQLQGGVSIPTLDQLTTLYSVVQNKLAVGNNLLAATPVITLAVLTGSVYALTSVASRMSAVGGDKWDEKLSAPAYASATPQYNIAGKTVDPAGGYNGLENGGLPTALSGDQLAASPSINLGSSVQSAAQAVTQHQRALAARTASQVGETLNKIASVAQFGREGKNISDTQAHALQLVQNNVRDLLKQAGFEESLSDAEVIQIAAALGLGARVGFGGNGSNSEGSGAQSEGGGAKKGKKGFSLKDFIGFSASFNAGETDTVRRALQSISKLSGSSSFKKSASIVGDYSDKIAKSLEVALGSNGELRDSWNKAVSAISDYSDTSSRTDTLSQQAQALASMVGGQSVNLAKLGAMIRQGEGGVSALSQKISGMDAIARKAGENLYSRFSDKAERRAQFYQSLGYDSQMANFMARVQTLTELPGMAQHGERAAAAESALQGISYLMGGTTGGLGNVFAAFGRGEATRQGVGRDVAAVPGNIASNQNEIAAGRSGLGNPLARFEGSYNRQHSNYEDRRRRDDSLLRNEGARLEDWHAGSTYGKQHEENRSLFDKSVGASPISTFVRSAGDSRFGEDPSGTTGAVIRGGLETGKQALEEVLEEVTDGVASVLEAGEQFLSKVMGDKEAEATSGPVPAPEAQQEIFAGPKPTNFVVDQLKTEDGPPPVSVDPDQVLATHQEPSSGGNQGDSAPQDDGIRRMIRRPIPKG